MFRSICRLSLLVAALAVVALALPMPAAAQDGVDLRSPDARDAARGAPSRPAPPEIARPDGFDWEDAAIGAGGALGVVLIAVSIAFGVVHRRRVRLAGSVVRSDSLVI